MSHSACFSSCRYLPSFLSLAVLTKILRFAQNDCRGRRRKNHSACFPDCRHLPAFLPLTILTKILCLRSECLPREVIESFSTLFSRPVFTGIPVTCDTSQDSSLSLRMTAAEGGERIIRYAFRTAGIYRRSCHLRLLPRFFASAQNDRRRERRQRHEAGSLKPSHSSAFPMVPSSSRRSM